MARQKHDIEWDDGDGWADLVPRLTHARRMRIVRVLPRLAEQAGPDGQLDAQLDVEVELAAAHIGAWSLGEVDAVTGPPAAAFDPLPDDAVDEIVKATIERWSGRADPNATTESSAPGLSDSPSVAPTPTSSTPSGS